jgi:hypothetical protein
MAVARSKTTTRVSPDSTAAVDDFMATLDHPFKAEIDALRQIILGADPSIAEGIKWKVPSFRTTEYFATLNLRAQGGVGVIFHLGAKVREIAPEGLSIDDPAKLLKWLANDRAMASFGGLADVEAKRGALEAVVRQWIRYV